MSTGKFCPPSYVTETPLISTSVIEMSSEKWIHWHAITWNLPNWIIDYIINMPYNELHDVFVVCSCHQDPTARYEPKKPAKFLNANTAFNNNPLSNPNGVPYTGIGQIQIVIQASNAVVNGTKAL